MFNIFTILSIVIDIIVQFFGNVALRHTSFSIKGCPVVGPHAVPTSPQPDSTDACDPSVKDCVRMITDYLAAVPTDAFLRSTPAAGTAAKLDQQVLAQV